MAANHLSVVDTAPLPPAQRIQRWRGALASLCGPMHIDDVGRDGLMGRIESAKISQVQLCRIHAGPHRLALPATQCGPGKHDVIKAVVQLDGSSTFGRPDRQLTIAPGDSLIYDVSRPHEITTSTESEHLVIVLPKRVMPADIQLGPHGFVTAGDASGVGRLIQGLVETALREQSCAHHEDDFSDLVLRTLRLALLTTHPRVHMSRRQRMAEGAKRYIAEHLRERGLSVAEIAAAFRCSPRYLQLAFAETGESIADYIWSQRLERCREEMLTPALAMTLTELAFSWGFSSSSHFSRSFKQRYGHRPSELIRR